MTGRLLRVALFMAFLVPVVIDQYSVNYAFAIFAGIMALRTGRLRSPDQPLLIAMTTFILIYVVSLALEVTGGVGLELRRTVSFIIFMTIFAFSLIDLDETDIEDFKTALILICVAFAGDALVRFFLAGGNGYGYGLKNVVGSQRYGFVYLLALFTLIHLPPSTRWWTIARIVAGLLIASGLLLTFSRASVIAVGVTLPLYLLAPLAFKSGRTREGLRKLWMRAGLGLVYVIVLAVVMPVTYQFYSELILSRYTTAVEGMLPWGTAEAAPVPPQADVFLPEGSEGTRLSIWKAVIDQTMDRPLLGSGYLGSWTLGTVVTGSAHSQYIDVLMRTGLFGLAVYIFILGRLLVFLWQKDQGLFWGTIAILVYGLFHETFKESQGAFILAFLIGMHASSLRALRRAPAAGAAVLQ